jgi:hypothetical protein
MNKMQTQFRAREEMRPEPEGCALSEPWWTLAMVLTWIIWRTESSMREVWFRYHMWRDHGQAVGVDVSVSEVRRLSVGALPRNSDALPRNGPERFLDEYTPYVEAVNELCRHLRKSGLVAEAIPDHSTKLRRVLDCDDDVSVASLEVDRRPIPPGEWEDLLLDEDVSFCGRPDDIAHKDDIEIPRYRSVRVSSRKVMEIWPKSLPEGTGRRGRKTAIDLSLVYNEVARLMGHHGAFSPDDPAWTCQARLEEKITTFVEDKFGEDAVKSRATIRTYCTKALEKLQTPNANN